MTPIRIVAFLFLIVVLFSCMVSAGRQRGKGNGCPKTVGCDGTTDNFRWGKRSSTLDALRTDNLRWGRRPSPTISDIRKAAEMLLRRRRLNSQQNYVDDIEGTQRTFLSLYNRLRSRDYYR